MAIHPSFEEKTRALTSAEPLCPVFGECGGCQYQDIAYEDQLRLKEHQLLRLCEEAGVCPEAVDPIVASPKRYHYRSRLDLRMIRTRSGEFFMGFTRAGQKFGTVEADHCPIALEPLSEFLPHLKIQAMSAWRDKYRNANLTAKTGEDGRVCWGGIGRGSLRTAPEDYLSVTVDGVRIFYSLDTFFQANVSILPKMMEYIRSLGILGKDTVFYDLYGGVGLFGLCLYKDVKEVILIEENKHAVKVAGHNAAYNKMERFRVIEGRMEETLQSFLDGEGMETTLRHTAMIDPPRAGLSAPVRGYLKGLKPMHHLLYLSCNPEALVRDLKDLTGGGWDVVKICPFDFFPQTRHLETLAVLKVKGL